MLKRCVVRCCLKVETVEIARMSAGSLVGSNPCVRGGKRKRSGTKCRAYSWRVVT